MTRVKLVKSIMLLTICFITSQASIADPILYEGRNLTGTALRLELTSVFSGYGFPDIDDFIYFSPLGSYYAYRHYNGKIDIRGSNGAISNKSIYVPQCWTVSLRSIPRYVMEANFENGKFYPNLVSRFTPIYHGFFGPRVVNFIDHSGYEDHYIGYGTTRDPSCVPTNEPLFISNPSYEFIGCQNYLSDGFVSWDRLNGNVTYILQKQSGAKWITHSKGKVSFRRYTKTRGRHSLRVRASAQGINGPWKRFNIYLPSCPGTQPR